MNDSFNDPINDGERFINIATVCFIGIMLPIGLIGNSLVLYVYAYRFKPSPFNIFIIFLAVMDFIFCVLDLPLEIANMTYHKEFGGCKFVVTLGTVTAVATGQCLIAIAALRFNAVCRPLKQTISIKTARCLSVAFFLTSCVVSWPAAVVLTNVHKSLGDGFYVSNCASSPEYEHTIYPVIYNLFQFLLFLGAFFSICVLYCITGSRLWKRQKYGISCQTRELTSSTSSERYFEPTKGNIPECKSTDTIFSICPDEAKSPDRTFKSNVINQSLIQVKSHAGSQNLYDLKQLRANILEQSKRSMESNTKQTDLSSNAESNTDPTDQSSYKESDTKQTDQSSNEESNTKQSDQSSNEKSNTDPTDQSSNAESNTKQSDQSSKEESDTKQTDQSSYKESDTKQTDQSSNEESNLGPTDQSSYGESNTKQTDQSESKLQSRFIRSNSFPSPQSNSIQSDSFSAMQSKKGYASFRKPSSNCQNQPNTLIQYGHIEQTNIEYENPIYHERSSTNADNENNSTSSISIGEKSSEDLNQSSLDESRQEEDFMRPPDSNSVFHESDRTLKESNKSHLFMLKKTSTVTSIITGSNRLDPVKMLVIMALIFFVSYVPHLSLMIYIELGWPLKLVPVSESIIGIIIRSYFLGSVCNPILYGCYNRKFREEVKSIWKTFKSRINRYRH